MDGAIVAQWVATAFVAGGLIYSMRRNGKKEKQKDAELKTELTAAVATINKNLEDPNNGLGAIRKAVEEQRVNCANISSALSEQVKANRRDIDNQLKKRRK